MSRTSLPRPRRSASAPASIADVARTAGVSIATVSRVVNGVTGRYSAETAERVRRAVLELGYRPAAAGRSLRRGENRMVGVIAGNLANPAMAAIVASLEVALRDIDRVLLVCDAHDRAELQDELLGELLAQRAAATVLLAAVASDGLAEALSSDRRLVFVNRRAPDGASAPYVGIDNRLAGRDVASFLYARGHRRVALLHGSLASSATGERVAGFESHWSSLSGTEPTLRYGEDGGEHLEIGARGAATLGAAMPEAVFCLSDLIAWGAARELRARGRDPARDNDIIGVDDSPLNDWVAPWLGSVRVPYRRFGAAIATMVDRLVTDGDDHHGSLEIVLPHELVPRERRAALDIAARTKAG